MSAGADIRDHRALIVGAGGIGMSLAIVFARAGVPVTVFDALPAARAGAIALGEDKLKAAGAESTGVTERIRIVDSLEDGAYDATLVIECTPERLEIKQSLFADLESVCRPDAILMSVSSTIPISRSAGGLRTRRRALVAHPVNPPHLIPVIELVPAEFTDPSVVELARSAFVAAGMTPVILNAEIEGFVVNRLQGAILREAMHLVGDGIVNPGEIDAVVREALAPRWVVAGPFETADLNTRGGFAAHAETIGCVYGRFGRERADQDAWTGDVIARVTADRRNQVPLSEWATAALRREHRVARVLSYLKDAMAPERSAPDA